MTAPSAVRGPLEVSVIVPARNEEASLGNCLQSLASQAGIGFEITVVDDGSTDRTRQIALGFPGVRVIPAPPLETGWVGKNNAVAAGARHASAPWLLFTDADTIHAAGSLRRAVDEAGRMRADLLSYSPAQEVRGLAEKAVMPVIFAELASRYRPAEVSDPASPAAAANGQYLLVRRTAYDAVGGHAAVAGSILEDVALARNLKRAGFRIYFRFGGDALRTRMYRTFAQLREGWTKNLALLFARPSRLAGLRLAEFAAIAGSAAAAATLLTQRRPAGWGFAAAAVGLFAWFQRRIRRAHFAWDANALAVFGLPLFAYLLLRSRQSHRRRSVSWKGRQYAPESGAR